MTKKTVFSGIQPSGQLTLGNYLGAIQQYVKMQHTHTVFYCVVDQHAITVRQNPEELRFNTLSLAAWYLAAGIQPEKATLFVQSHVPAHTEAGWLLGTFSQMGELERMTQFKDKSQQHRQNINAGLFTYPCLMAADIVLYHAEEIPVGHDQLQHIELARNVVERFNGIYGSVLTLPKGVVPQAAARVKDLQTPEKKMSKSLPGKGCILLQDSPKEMEKKFKAAVTDSQTRVAFDEENKPGVSNLLSIYSAFTGQSLAQAETTFADMQYGSFKQAVADSVIAVLAPMQQEYTRIMQDKAELQRCLAIGAEKAHGVSHKTLLHMKDVMGFLLP